MQQLVAASERDAAEVKEGNGQLDELAEAEDALRKETRQLQNRALLLKRQVAQLEKTAQQTSAQLSEAEDVYRRAREEEFNATRRYEILDWKMQVVKTHLSTAAASGGVGRSSGHGSARSGGGDSGSQGRSRTGLRTRGSEDQSPADSACEESKQVVEGHEECE